MAAVLRAQGRNLWRALAGGGPDPPPLLAPAHPAWLGRLVRALLAVTAVVLALLVIDYGQRSGSTLLVVVWALSVLLLALVGYRPLLAWRIGWLLALVALVLVESGAPAPPVPLFEVGQYDWMLDGLGVPIAWFPGQVPVFLVLMFAVGTAQELGVQVWVLSATLGLTWAAYAAADGSAYYDHAFPASLVLAAPMLAGYLVRLGAHAAQRRLAEVAEHGTVLTERARIALELHDVVAHHMSMIAVRAETAPYRLGDVPESARAEFADISQASREALTEMRRLLGVLRSDEPEPPIAPQPGLADLPELVDAARAAGAEVTLDVDATLPELPAGVGVSAYRIVQEALTNAARHAPGAPVRVVVGRSGGGLSLSVRNGPSAARRPESGPGHGVRGMRERAAMLGGELRAGPSGDGGFEVSATLPLRVTG